MNKLRIILIGMLFNLWACAYGDDSSTKTNKNLQSIESKTNLLDNRVEKWGFFQFSGKADMKPENEVLKIDIQNSGEQNWSLQLYQDGFILEKGCKYRVQFEAFSTIDRTIDVRVQKNGGDYRGYGSLLQKITNEKKIYTFDFTMNDNTDKIPRFVVNLGTPNGGKSLMNHQIFLSNIKLTILDDSAKVVEEQEKEIAININQIGYLPSNKKIAIFRGEKADSEFNVIDSSTKKIVYTGKIEKPFKNDMAFEINYYGDFSKVTIVGEYYISTKTMGESYKFKISNDVYKDVLADLCRFLYMQRSGIDMPMKFAGEFTHVAGHTQKALIYGTKDYIDVSGGWYDAGDYGRYVVPVAKTIADLIHTYKSNEELFRINYNIPESINKVPDILDEIRYALAWMLKMQEKKSGGVYHKVTTRNFPGVLMPQDDIEELVVSPISDAATGDFAAVMAMSYDLYKDIDKQFADTCLTASKSAWKFLETKKTLTEFKNPEGINTGQYGDTHINDEVFWAAAELYKATKEEKYGDYIKKSYNSSLNGLGWMDVGSYGAYAYLTTDKSRVDKKLYDEILKDFIRHADLLLNIAKNDGYFITVEKVYPWGSNMSVANNAMFLQMANKLSPNKEYMETAKNAINYIMGNNPMGISYITGHGTKQVLHPHHRPSQAMGKVVPGMVIGGPNSNLEDPIAQQLLKGKAPAKAFIDDEGSYSCNEVTTYWNSPVIYILANELLNRNN